MKKEPDKAEAEAPAVGPGDHIYFQTGEGPKRGHVKAVGRHGVTAHADGKHHKVKHKHILGIAQRMQREYKSIDAGEDGQIVEDGKGSRHYVHGEVPDAKRYADAAAEVEVPADGELVTRAMEVEMRGIPTWQVIDGDLPAGSIVAGATKEQAQDILQAVESLDVPYEVRARTVVRDGAEHHGVLLVFEPEPKQAQDVVNAIASVQRQTALDTDEIMVFGRKVGGMDEMTVSTKQVRGRTVVFVGDKKGMDQRKAYVSPDLASFSKGLNTGLRVMFFKDGIANKQGLALQNVTDKAGHQTKRWKKTGPDEKKDKPAPKVDVGHLILFRGQGGDKKQGKVIAAGKDGVTVQADDGGEHRVEHDKIEGAKKPKAGKSPEEKEAAFEALIAEKSEQDQQAFRAARADGIAIPPAWTDVKYFGKSPENGIIAQGTDAKGRRQRVEVPEYRAQQIAEKHARIAKSLSPRMPEIEGQLREAAKGGDEEAKVLYLITQTGFRIGGAGDGKAEEQAYGASTLLGQHVEVDGDTVRFDFPGKKGVRQQHEIKDPVIAAMFKDAEPDKPVFNTRDAKVRAKWKKYGGEKVHDIRSHVATMTAKAALAEKIPPVPEGEAERKALISEIAEAAAKKLGNNPAESLKTYINHDVFKELHDGRKDT